MPSPGVPGARAWRVVADPNPHVMVVRWNDGRMRASVVGARSTFLDVDQSARAVTVGVRLAVGTLPALTGLPAAELLDRSASFAQVFGAEGSALTRRLEDEAQPAAALAVLWSFLGPRLAGGAVDWRIRGFMSRLGARSTERVEGVCRSLGVAPRTLLNATREHVGMSPKAVQRVHRLLTALMLLRRRGGVGAGRVAYEAGFADHAHMVNDCRRLLGESPGTFLARADADSYKTREADGD